MTVALLRLQRPWCISENSTALTTALPRSKQQIPSLSAGLQPTEADQDRIDNGIAEAAAAKVYVAERSAELLEQHAEALMQAEIEFVR